MYYPIENGSVYEIPDNAFGFIYKCQLPPVGFGVNVNSGRLQETDILKRSDIPEEQYWERYVLPHDFKSRRKIEKERQKFDKFYFDTYLENIRRREWKRRLCGVWFWNYNPSKGESELIYITGTHYFYITCWKFQGKHMEYRVNDMETWYIVRYIEQNPNALGLNEITKRKLGKTARLGCWLYERTSRRRNKHAGLQSKADDDAEEVMKKAIVQPWQKLPDFFRPTYDTMKGDDPKELRFFHPSRKGATTEEDRDDDEALESWIDFGSSGEAVYDGPELDSYGSDEAGKTKKPVSIKERQSVVRYCSEIDGEFCDRKQWYTTTVEIEPGEEMNYDFQDMTANSNPLELDANGRTGTGLYTHFLPAQKGMFFDRYGYPDEKRALQFLNNTIAAYEAKGDLRGLSSFKRKNPRNFKEAFSVDGTNSLYNPEILNRRLDEIEWTGKLTERGDLVWKDGFKIKRPTDEFMGGERVFEPNEILWVPNANGRFERVAGWKPKVPNMVTFDGQYYAPNNPHIAIGCDPFRYDKTKDKRRSNCAAYAYQITEPMFPDRFDDTFVLSYVYRADSTRESNDDILKMAWYCGASVLFERQVNHWKNDFRDWDCAKFYDWIPGEVEPGVSASTTYLQDLCNYTESYINQHIGNVWFKELIRKDTGWLGFKVEDTETFDRPMAAGITLIKVKGQVYRSQNRVLNISDFFPTYKN